MSTLLCHHTNFISCRLLSYSWKLILGWSSYFSIIVIFDNRSSILQIINSSFQNGIQLIAQKQLCRWIRWLRTSTEGAVVLENDDIRDRPTERRMASDAEPMMVQINVFNTFS